MTGNQLTFTSEDTSRRLGRSRRLLQFASLGFVFLALCLLVQDLGRLIR